MYRSTQPFGAATETDYGLEPGLMEAYLPRFDAGQSSGQPSSTPLNVLPIVLIGGVAAIAILYFATR
jgi:hypothetical protein